MANFGDMIWRRLPVSTTHFSLWLWLRLRSDCQATPSSSNMPAWYPLWLDSWQLSLKYFNSATELLSDSVAQLVIRAWQAICQVVNLSSSLSHCLFFHSLFSGLYSSPFSVTLTWVKIWLSGLEHVKNLSVMLLMLCTCCTPRPPPHTHTTH